MDPAKPDYYVIFPYIILKKSQPRVTAVTDLLGGQLSLTTFYFLPFTFKSQRSSLADANSKATS